MNITRRELVAHALCGLNFVVWRVADAARARAEITDARKNIGVAFFACDFGAARVCGSRLAPVFIFLPSARRRPGAAKKRGHVTRAYTRMAV